MDAETLNSLTGAIERALKSQRLILGESTENVDSRNLHASIVNLLQQIKGSDDSIPEIGSPPDSEVPPIRP